MKRFNYALILLAVLGLNACDDDSPTTDQIQCDPTCKDGETCVNGECKAEQAKPETCDPTCKDGETCVNGECQDACHNSCDADQKCEQGECKTQTPNEPGLCNPACENEQICVNGTCADKPEESPNECDPECPQGMTCMNGECVDEEDSPEAPTTPQTPAEPIDAAFNITPLDGLVTILGMRDTSFRIVLNSAPDKDVIIPLENGNPKAGTLSADRVVFTHDNWNEQQEIQIAAGTETLDQEIVNYTITAGPTQSADARFDKLAKVELSVTHYSKSVQPEKPGAVIPEKLTLDKKTADILLMGSPVTIKASFDKENVSDPYIWWDVSIEQPIDKDTATVSDLVSISYKPEEHSITLKSNVTLSSKTCIDKKLDLARTLKVTAKHSSGVTATATVELKPYMPIGLTYGTIRDTIKDYSTPGHKNKLTFDKYGLGEMGCGYYDDRTEHVLTQDMIKKYVTPLVYTVGSSNYGTRASVVAAARFLILQFPKDIPYMSGAAYDNEDNETRTVPPTVGRYTWTSYEYASKRDDVRLFGFNLTGKGYKHYTSFTNDDIIIGGAGQEKLTAWGCVHKTSKGNPITLKGVEVNNPYNGLRCSGFVNWSMMNGRFYFSDWNTALLAKTGDCKDASGNIVRNFRCEDLVYDERVKSNGKKYHWANANSRHLDVFGKMNALEESDFVKIKDLTDKSDIKAGDLLWYSTSTKCAKNADGTCPDVTDTCTSGGGGHVAMILGLTRNSDKSIKNLYVAEAASLSGNRLSTISIKDLKSSKTWAGSSTDDGKTCTVKDSRLIKMDHVYNYYHTKNPKTVTEDLNTYKYTEYWK